MLFVAQNQTEPFHFECLTGPKVMEQFVQSSESIAKRVYSVKQQHKYFSGQPLIAKEDATNCWICEEPLEHNFNNPTVLDHCHFTGEFLGWAHNTCNINRRFLNYTPLFAHNLSNYDLHHVILALQGSNMRNTVSIVPNTDEKYIALEIGVLVYNRQDKNGVIKPVYEYIRLLDSFRFMASSLDSLAQNLPSDQFTLLEHHFKDWPESSVQMLKRKGFFPYCYIDNFNKLKETALPPREKWMNSLQQYQVSVTEDEYKHSLEVFEKFQCETIEDYYSLYLKTDVFLLAAVILCFRKVCYETYGLDCCQYYTASNLSGDAMLKLSKAPLRLLKEREQLDMVEGLIRGGVSSIYNKRLAVANNKYLPNFNPKAPSTFIVMIDANNLYGGIMEKFPLPLNNFEYTDGNWDPEIQKAFIQSVLETPDDSDIGYVLEVDLSYPDELHDLHSDFPLAPTKQKVDACWLGDYQEELLNDMQMNAPPSSDKLIQTLFPKKNYILHYQTLKLYVQLGLKVEKLHRSLAFNQSKWLEPYVKLNTQKRKQAKNKFEENFYKLMVNSAFGKTCEGKRNRIKVKLARSEEETLKWTSAPQMKAFKIIDENLATISLNQSEIEWDKPTIVGACILDLSKKFMYDFHYNTMKKHFNCKLLYSDTDSFVYEIFSNDFFADLKRKTTVKDLFDFSNFPTNHEMYDQSNARVTLKFKDEMGGKMISEFVGLKPKLYSIKLADG